MTSLPPLSELVAELPEVYQPIYGHPEYDARAARSRDSRLAHIMKVHDALKTSLGRPLRILDLGCAQGWFCFHLAAAGAEVIGIDALAVNINLCNLLALENRGLKVRFQLAEVQQIPSMLTDTPFDLVLGLSVFHHLCFHNGREATREVMKALFTKIPCGIFEFALNSEPVKWAPSLSDDPAYLINTLPFYRVLSEHETHLSSVKRPLYFGSTRYWYFDNDIVEFEDSRRNDRGRNYFFTKNLVAKLYHTTGGFGENNRNAIARAAAFLRSPPPAFPTPPKLLYSGEAFGAAWLVQEKIEGEQLDTVIRAGKPFDARVVLLDILGVLASLEHEKLYHADVRTWNVLIDAPGHAHLIDYNEITPISRDCQWPWQPMLAFFLFMREVTKREIATSRPLRQPFLSPGNLPEPYQCWSGAFWALPVEQWSFANLLESLQRLPATSTHESEIPMPSPSSLAVWMQSIEQYLSDLSKVVQSHEEPLSQLINMMMASNRSFDERIKRLESMVSNTEKR